MSSATGLTGGQTRGTYLNLAAKVAD